ncbi:MAG TPA: formate dehydrogenase accessory sulfurtransferase FdhD [Gemmatimonadaceae bacterium]|nr:formate dehydrogenase accessory sulfurtransferase FdhD [Gemmatimonadaceae bacterium]
MPGVQTCETLVRRVQGGHDCPARDLLAVEEPLEIRVVVGDGATVAPRTVAVTMRTPGHDAELAVGFLLAEGVLRDDAPPRAVQVEPAPVGVLGAAGSVTVHLAGDGPTLAPLARHSYTSSACGVCGRVSLDALLAAAARPLPAGAPPIDAALVHALPAALRRAQPVFADTGGLHAAALFDAAGRLLALREDVGRHNAVDKVVGARLLAGALPAHDGVLLVSGRASFELVQKAVAAGIPVLAAVGAPSSLAVELAAAAGMTLLGFVRDGRFNVYADADRVRAAGAAAAAPALEEVMA